MLRQHLYGDGTRFVSRRKIGKSLCVQVDLGEYLICKGAVHDARWMACRITQVHKTTFSKQQQVVVGIAITIDLMYLRLDLFPLPILAHVSRIDFIIEVADITHDRTRLECAQHRRITDINISRC